MGRKKKNLPLLENVLITDVAAEGKALAKVNDLVVFVPYVVPGDVVDLQVRKKKHSYAEAEAVTFHHYSERRSAPFCKHFGLCGGCKWQILPYEDQLKYKQKQVVDNLTRIGKIALPEINPILGSAHTMRYRNKLEFTFSNKRWLTYDEIREGKEYPHRETVGFHIPGAFDKVLAIDECMLMDDRINHIRNAIRDYAYEHELPFYDLRAGSGMLRTLVFRTSNTGELMCILIARIETEAEMAQFQDLLKYTSEQFPEITSLMYAVNNKCNDSYSDLEIKSYRGRNFMLSTMENLQFKVGPKSFYQTNHEQAYILYKVVREFAALTGEELVYDLYTGTGTIANFVARQAQKVIGIEYVTDAIEDARFNSQLNSIDNTLFFAGDMKDILTPDFIAEHGRPDVIITDPPRAGMHPDVVDVILQTAPERIVYVSCNPATQARDLQLMDACYEVTKVQPVDMFPQTHHVENIVLLNKRTSQPE